MEKKSKNDLPLNEKQKMFCREYIKDLNATQAAIRAGYSQKTAGQIGEALLKKLEIQKEVNGFKEKRIERVVVEGDDVLRELLKLAKSDIRNVFNEDGTMKPVSEWDDSIALCIASVQVDEIWEGYGEDRTMVGYTRKVKFWDKVKSLELLGKHLKMFTDTIDLGDKTINALRVIRDDIPRTKK